MVDDNSRGVSLTGSHNHLGSSVTIQVAGADVDTSGEGVIQSEYRALQFKTVGTIENVKGCTGTEAGTRDNVDLAIVVRVGRGDTDTAGELRREGVEGGDHLACKTIEYGHRWCGTLPGPDNEV